MLRPLLKSGDPEIAALLAPHLGALKKNVWVGGLRPILEALRLRP